MQVKITTGERRVGLLGGSTETYLKCEIVLTAEEQVILPQCGLKFFPLTTSYQDRDQYDGDFDGILLDKAVKPGGDEHVVGNAGQLQEKENECIRNLRVVQINLNNLKGYEVEKSYTLDLEAEENQ